MSEKNGMDSGPGMGKPFATFARLQVFSPTSTPVPIIYSLTNNQNKRPYNHPNQHPSTAPNRTTLSTSSLDSPSLHLLISPLTLSAFLLNTPPCFPLAFSNTFSSSAVASAVVPVMLTLEPCEAKGRVGGRIGPVGGCLASSKGIGRREIYLDELESDGSGTRGEEGRVDGLFRAGRPDDQRHALREGFADGAVPNLRVSFRTYRRGEIRKE